MFISIVSIDHRFSGPAQCSLPTGAQPRGLRHRHHRAKIEGRLYFSVQIPTSYATEMQGKKILQNNLELFLGGENLFGGRKKPECPRTFEIHNMNRHCC